MEQRTRAIVAYILLPAGLISGLVLMVARWFPAYLDSPAFRAVYLGLGLVVLVVLQRNAEKFRA